MNILIKSSQYSTYLTVAPTHTDALIALLPHLRTVEGSGYGDSEVFTVADMPPEVSFKNSSALTALSPREEALKKALSEKSDQWVNAFTERDKHAARIKELERELVAARESQP